jgi:hypothetical protein
MDGESGFKSATTCDANLSNLLLNITVDEKMLFACGFTVTVSNIYVSASDKLAGIRHRNE